MICIYMFIFLKHFLLFLLLAIFLLFNFLTFDFGQFYGLGYIKLILTPRIIAKSVQNIFLKICLKALGKLRNQQGPEN